MPYPVWRRWLRLQLALNAIQSGASLTAAAHAAGFADSAHLTRSCRAMFGITPSEAARATGGRTTTGEDQVSGYIQGRPRTPGRSWRYEHPDRHQSTLATPPVHTGPTPRPGRLSGHDNRWRKRRQVATLGPAAIAERLSSRHTTSFPLGSGICFGIRHLVMVRPPDTLYRRIIRLLRQPAHHRRSTHERGCPKVRQIKIRKPTKRTTVHELDRRTPAGHTLPF